MNILHICDRYYRFSIPNCTNIFIEREILRISISVTDGSFWISNEVIRRFCAFGTVETFVEMTLEFVYDDIFLVWEIIAAARQTVSQRFVLFIALAMMKTYREIILDHRMDFTDIIKFFNGLCRSICCTIDKNDVFFFFRFRNGGTARRSRNSSFSP